MKICKLKLRLGKLLPCMFGVLDGGVKWWCELERTHCLCDRSVFTQDGCTLALIHSGTPELSAVLTFCLLSLISTERNIGPCLSCIKQGAVTQQGSDIRSQGKMVQVHERRSDERARACEISRKSRT